MAKNDDIHPLFFFLMMSSYDSVWSISQNEIFFFLTILPLSNENKSLRTERCSITDRTGYVTSNATWVSLVALKGAEQRRMSSFWRNEFWQLPEFSKLSLICKQSKKHAGSRDTVTSRAHDFLGSARSFVPFVIHLCTEAESRIKGTV